MEGCIGPNNIFFLFPYQFYQNILLEIERFGSGEKSVAVRLHPMVQALAKGGVHVNEREIRAAAKQLYGPAHCGVQYFLDPERQSPKPIRHKTCGNTKGARCIFIKYRDVGAPTIDMLCLGTCD